MINQLFRNLGASANSSVRFADTTAQAGPAFTRPEVNRGAAVGDIDNDGDVDVMVTTNNGRAQLLLNRADSGGSATPRNHWLQVRLEQPTGNRFALGARVGIERAGKPTLWRRVRTDGSYLSSSDHRLHIGLGPSPTIDAVVVEWPNVDPGSGTQTDSSRERWTNVQVDRAITVRRGTAPR
jgi:enediyne biosynthesis protein E4